LALPACPCLATSFPYDTILSIDALQSCIRRGAIAQLGIYGFSSAYLWLHMPDRSMRDITTAAVAATWNNLLRIKQLSILLRK